MSQGLYWLLYNPLRWEHTGLGDSGGQLGEKKNSAVQYSQSIVQTVGQCIVSCSKFSVLHFFHVLTAMQWTDMCLQFRDILNVQTFRSTWSWVMCFQCNTGHFLMFRLLCSSLFYAPNSMQCTFQCPRCSEVNCNMQCNTLCVQCPALCDVQTAGKFLVLLRAMFYVPTSGNFTILLSQGNAVHFSMSTL